MTFIKNRTLHHEGRTAQQEDFGKVPALAKREISRDTERKGWKVISEYDGNDSQVIRMMQIPEGLLFQSYSEAGYEIYFLITAQ